MRVTKMGKKHLTISVVAFMAICATWFLALDKSHFTEGCDDCYYQKDIIQYRIFSVPFHETTTEQHAPVELVARDLGKPCPHHSFYSLHKRRLWGLCFCARPCISGIFSMSSDKKPWYQEEIRMKVQQVASVYPKSGEEFLERVIYEHDWNYWKRFREELLDDNLEPIALSGNTLSEEDVGKIVGRIEIVAWLELESGNEQPDENAAAILALGERAGPYLVQRITNTGKSRWLEWASVGDVAHFFLTIIYKLNWPTSEFVESHHLKAHDSYFKYYLNYLETTNDDQRNQNRKKLQQAWNDMIEKSLKSKQSPN
jgi:hypothetical protein